MQENHKNYLEVLGSAEIHEQVSKFRASFTLTVRAASRDVAMNECLVLRQNAIQALLDAGLRMDELQEGGADISVPWYARKKVGQETEVRILLSCDDSVRMLQGLAALEPLFQNQRHLLEVKMLPAEYANNPKLQEQGLAQAFAHARSKAESIAQEAGVKLGPPLEIEEYDPSKCSSGMYYDYGVCGAPLMSGGGGGDAPPTALDNPSRSVRFNIRVRFALPATPVF